MNRNRKQLFVLSIAAIAIVCVLLSTSKAQVADRQAAPTVVGVCDVMEIFNKYNRVKDVKEMLTRQNDDRLAEGEKRAKNIIALQQELASYVPGKPEYKNVQEKIEHLKIDARVWMEEREISLRREHLELIKDIYKEIEVVVKDIARQQGMTLVLQREPDSLDARNLDEMTALISQKKVLYASQNLDITPLVLQRLNETYRAKGNNQ